MIEINTEKIQTELQDLAGNIKVKVKLNKRLDIASKIWRDDRKFKGYYIELNPTYFHSGRKLDEHMNIFRRAVSGNHS